MSETFLYETVIPDEPLFALSLREQGFFAHCQRSAVNYQIVRPVNRLQGRHPQIAKRQAALKHMQVEACLMGWLGISVEQPQEVSADKDCIYVPLPRCFRLRSGLLGVIRTLLKRDTRGLKSWTSFPLQMRVRLEDRTEQQWDYIERRVHKLLHRGLDSNVGRRA